MVDANGWPEVSPCLIMIHDAEANGVSDTFLMQTAVKKYYIGIGQDIEKYRMLDLDPETRSIIE